MKIKWSSAIAIILFVVIGRSYGQNSKSELVLQEGEKVWAGVVRDGHLMPFSEDYTTDFTGNKSNQIQPILLTSKGQYVWSEDPFKFEVKKGSVVITDPSNKFTIGSCGKTLAEVQRFVSKKYFAPSGLLPDTLLFTAPQYKHLD